MNYYNEYDKKAAAWLRELIKAGLIPAGTVDERSIVDVQPEELTGYTQCHFFAGIGGWSLALQLAGVGPDVPVWTGSCPCQPFSSAGKGRGTDDERHLWPEFASLIRECKPATVFGEQVASKAGREWFDGVSTDLEDMGYAAAAADLCAAGVNAPHIRQRLFWVADSEGAGTNATPTNSKAQREREYRGDCVICSRLGDADHTRPQGHAEHEPHSDEPGRIDASAVRSGGAAGWDHFDLVRCVEPTKDPGRFVEKRRRIESGTFPVADGLPGRVAQLRGLGNAIVPQVAAEFIQAYMEIKTEGANQ
jgi:DNA (cytosine-5)-methyltransferase 1